MPRKSAAAPRSTRTIAIQQNLHDQLRLAAAQQSLRLKRRLTIQELVEQAIQTHLASLEQAATSQQD